MAEDRRELLKKFEVYDKTVDVVSCWEAYLNHVYSDSFPNFHFDRFPTLDGDLTPDFTAFFDDSYGIIGEIKRTFPNDEKAILSELGQLEKYDRDLGLKDAQGEYLVPDDCDTLLIIEGSSAPQIGTRLERIIFEDEKVEFETPPVLLRYQYNQDALQSRYEFQRVTQLESEFNDGQLAIDESLSNTIGEEGDYGTISCYPKYFNSVKVKRPLCNDPPPGPYIATHLWHKIFPGYLTEEQYEQWRATDGSKELTLDVTVREVTDSMNDYMKGGTVRPTWIQRGLDFLCGADLAEADDDKEYSVRYMGLVKDVNISTEQEEEQHRAEYKELANVLVRRYCEKSETEEEPEISEYDGDEDDSGEQSGLGDFT